MSELEKRGGDVVRDDVRRGDEVKRGWMWREEGRKEEMLLEEMRRDEMRGDEMG